MVDFTCQEGAAWASGHEQWNTAHRETAWAHLNQIKGRELWSFYPPLLRTPVESEQPGRGHFSPQQKLDLKAVALGGRT